MTDAQSDADSGDRSVEPVPARGQARAGPAGREAVELVGRERDDAAVTRFVERFAAAMTEAGFPRMPARAFVALLATDAGGLTAAELADRLKVSPAAISGAVRYLIQVDMVSRTREPGSRRDRYEVIDDVWFEASVRKDQMYRRWSELLADGVLALGPRTPAGLRMAETRAFFEFLQDEMPSLVKRWREYKNQRFGTGL